MKVSKKELETLIVDLFKRNAFNKDLLETKINPENEQTLNQKYRKVIKDEFFPDRGDAKLRYSILRKALNEYKKISKNPELLADLMLYYVENGVEFTNEYGDINEEFYFKIENMFSTALDYRGCPTIIQQPQIASPPILQKKNNSNTCAI